ncbi:MAG: type II toxin-antitoxin system Phd/YefM family antitoxin [Spirochaetia bacterium]
MKTTATDLRGNLYRYLDRVIENGEIIEIERKGRIVQITAVPRPSKLDNLKRRDTIVGDPEGIIDTDWSGIWNPDGGR